ncbi:MAG: 30S ribosome-binding factor RbfA [Patescibacteria group bacterium]|nr:30S ribosome-binding factor RbfA [Patescibacteria group bacterium]
MATSRRIKSANINLRDELAFIINKELEIPGALITVLRVESAADLKSLKAYITVMPEKYKNKAIKALEKLKSEIRRQLASRVKIKYIPMITFLGDQGYENFVQVERIVTKLHGGKNIRKKNN